MQHNSIGMKQNDLETPALLIDADAMERNLESMAAALSNSHVGLRPHVKITRATPELALKQIALGAIGVTCSKLSEAEVMADAGIRDILIANQIVGDAKVHRLMRLAASCDAIVAVDDVGNVADLANAARAEGANLRVVVEVNIGHNRCGVAPFGPALDLARLIVEQPPLEFAGVMGYDGHCTMKVAEEEREVLSGSANSVLANTANYIREAGIGVSIVSAGGTFTYRYASRTPGITEIQAGTYALMDTAFRDHGVREFECSLSVLSTVISRPRYPGGEHLAVIDLGQKSMSSGLGLPEVKAPFEAHLISLSDEHGRVDLSGVQGSWKVGEKLELWVRDANGTINLFDKFHVMRAGAVKSIWRIPIPGRHS